MKSQLMKLWQKSNANDRFKFLVELDCLYGGDIEKRVGEGLRRIYYSYMGTVNNTLKLKKDKFEDYKDIKIGGTD